MKKNMLIIVPFLPYPMESGGHQAIYHNILALKGLFNIYVLCIVREDDYSIEDKNKLDIIHPDIKWIIHIRKTKQPFRPNFFQKILISLNYRFVDRYIQERNEDDPFDYLYSSNRYPEDLLQHVNAVIRDFQISVVQIEMLLPLVCCIPNDLVKVFVHHELRFVRNQLTVKSLGINLYRQCGLDVNKVIEIGLLNKYDAVVALSEIDKTKLIENGVQKPVFASIAVVENTYKYNPGNAKKTVLSFVGPESHDPNKKGVIWFLQNCWKQLKSKNPLLSLQIIGKWSESTIQQLSGQFPDISFLGFVDDLSVAITGTTMIVPITIGSGIRMKILEAANLGVPFVTTSIGVEGLPFRNGKECFIADDVDSFIRDIVELQNDEIRIQYSQNAYQMVKEQYSLDALTSVYARIYAQFK